LRRGIYRGDWDRQETVVAHAYSLVNLPGPQHAKKANGHQASDNARFLAQQCDIKGVTVFYPDQKTDKMLGCHIFGYAAAEIIQVVGVALKMGATKADFDATIALHPSAAEELVTMRAKSYSKAP